MNMANRDKIFNALCEMSDRQVDPIVKSRIRQFIGRSDSEIKDELKILIDDIVYGSLTSDFEVMVLDTIWREAVKGSQ